MSLAEQLPVYLAGAGHARFRVGLLVRDEADNVEFIVDNAYIGLGPLRPILSVSWHVPGNEDQTRTRLLNRGDKQARSGFLPIWFGNLLPEGALRTAVEAQMPTGKVSEFDVIKRLGGDLPGAVIVGDDPKTPVLPDAPPPQATAEDASLRTGLPRLRFSLAGVQLKFSSMKNGGRLTLPAEGTTGRFIAKLPHESYPDLPEVEFSSMKLAEACGINIAKCELLPAEAAQGIPKRLRPGPSIFVVERFDRSANGSRIHIEDFNQVMGAVGDQKYARANEESVVNAVRRFSESGMVAVEEAIRRIVINLLIGNTDAHLKNWSLIFRDGFHPDLSPAYDIVSIVMLDKDESMALKLRGTRDPRRIDIDRFAGFAKYVGMTDGQMRKIVRDTVSLASDTWPKLAKDLPLARDRLKALSVHWGILPLTKGLPSPFG